MATKLGNVSLQLGALLPFRATPIAVLISKMLTNSYIIFITRALSHRSGSKLLSEGFMVTQSSKFLPLSPGIA